MGSKPSTINKPLSGREFPERQRMNGSVNDWLGCKKENDQKRLGFDKKYWVINGKVYDLIPFMDKHPGGSSWLQMCQGMDCTGLFETYHLNIKSTSALLSKYYIKDIENSENVTLFNWDRETSNYHNLRSKVFSKLINNNKRDKSLRKWNLPDIKMHVLSLVALSLWLISFIFFCSNPSIYRAIIAGFFLHPLVGVGHNFLHQADNKGWFGIETYWRYVINLSLYDLYEFRVHHAISHHTYINLDCDLEVSALEPIINFMTNAATNYILVYLYAPIFYFFLPFLLWLQRMINDIFIERKFVFIHHIPLIQLLTLFYFNNEISWRLLWIYYIMHGVTSIIVTIVSFPIHRSDYCWTEGDKNGTKDFVKHVLMSTVDYYVDCGIIASLFGFEMFNDHRAHHLLPTLDASKIEQIRPLIVEYCKKDELKKEFRQDGYDLGQLFVGMLRNWYRVYQL